MDPEIKELLEKNLEATEQTLKLVKKIHRAHIWTQIFSIIKWGVIIGVSVFGFLQLQPYLDMILKSYGAMFNIIQDLQGVLPK